MLPSGYSNAGFDGKSGSKLYDEKALIKVQQIAIFREFGMQRAEIKKIITAKDYDTNVLLDEQIAMLKEKQKEIENTIEAAEQMKILGMKNSMLMYFSKTTISDLAERIERWLQSDYYKKMEEQLDMDLVEFDEDAKLVYQKFELMDKSDCSSEAVYELMQEEFDLYTKHLGFMGVIFLLMMAIADVSEGIQLEEVYGEDIDPDDVKFMSDALISYAKRRYDEYMDKLVEFIVQNHDVVGCDYIDSKAVDLISGMLQLY